MHLFAIVLSTAVLTVLSSPDQTCHDIADRINIHCLCMGKCVSMMRELYKCTIPYSHTSVSLPCLAIRMHAVAHDQGYCSALWMQRLQHATGVFLMNTELQVRACDLDGEPATVGKGCDECAWAAIMHTASSCISHQYSRAPLCCVGDVAPAAALPWFQATTCTLTVLTQW